MNTYFADTCFFLALLNPRDVLHIQARQILAQKQLHLITTDWILVEVGDAMSAPANRSRFIAFHKVLCKRDDINIIAADVTSFRNGLDLFAARPDKSWTLTDCISFAAMKQYQLCEALTADHHFEQAGFHCLMRSPK